MVATLWSSKYSPWSVRARWALKVLQFEFNCLAYADVLFREWRLRLLVRKWHVTVPALVDKKTVIMDGKQMIEYVEEQQASEGPRLVREGVQEWLELADVVMENERCFSTQRCACLEHTASSVSVSLLRYHKFLTRHVALLGPSVSWELQTCGTLLQQCHIVEGGSA